MPLNLFKLEKLRIEAYTDKERKKAVIPGSIEVMFNPTTFTRTHAIKYTRTEALNASNSPSNYVYSPPGALSFQFRLDGTGVTDIGIMRLGPVASVKDRIKKFEDLCVRMNGKIHEPNFLKIIWGNHLNFPGRLQKLDITYELFDKGGDPIRAKLDVAFVEDMSGETIDLLAAKTSPDLTHLRIVRSGDTLPLLCKEIYGSSEHYLRVARDNGLDDFRNLIPGQKLSFPPLDSGEGAPSA